MSTKLTIIFEETNDDLTYSGGWPAKSVKTFISEYDESPTWTSFMLDMAEACEGVGYAAVKGKTRFLGMSVTDRDEEYKLEDNDGTPFDYS